MLYAPRFDYLLPFAFADCQCPFRTLVTIRVAGGICPAMAMVATVGLAGAAPMLSVHHYEQFCAAFMATSAVPSIPSSLLPALLSGHFVLPLRSQRVHELIGFGLGNCVDSKKSDL